MNNPIKIAIDGPVGSGKGTLAIALAKKINAFYVNTGAMYRALGLACLRDNVSMQNEENVISVLGKSSIELKQANGEVRVLLNNEDVTNEIFKPNAGKAASDVAVFPKIRKEMVIRQRKMAEDSMGRGESVVMEGRDIATDVIPDADIKIYLTADVRVRAQRRLDQFKSKGIAMLFDKVLKDLEERDRKDMQREASPLRIAKDAVVVDTTSDTIERTVDKVIEKLKERNLI